MFTFIFKKTYLCFIYENAEKNIYLLRGIYLVQFKFGSFFDNR